MNRVPNEAWNVKSDMSEANLITSYIFNEREYLVKMNVANNFLEISVTDKQSGEEWQCSYDQAYIENLTHKTGNFKQFDIFVTMVKSGLLKTSESITLELLTFDDLEALRVRRIKSHNSRTLLNKQKGNRRYLILIYNVEFDRILYPLPLEYCGPPDPALLQATIRRLEHELGKAREELQANASRSNSRQVIAMQKRIDELVAENVSLRDEVRALGRTSNGRQKGQVVDLQNAISHLEKSVLSERKNHHKLVEKMKREKMDMQQEIERLKRSEQILRAKLRQDTYSPSRFNRDYTKTKSLRTVYRNTSPKYQNFANKKPHIHSVSPKRTQSEDWTKMKSDNVTSISRTTNRKPKSRSSSTSSRNYSDAENPSYNNGILVGAKERRPSADRSRSSSKCSRTSTPSASNDHTLQIKLRNSEEEFRSIESRINTLQRLLRENVKL